MQGGMQDIIITFVYIAEFGLAVFKSPIKPQLNKEYIPRNSGCLINQYFR